VKTIPKPRRAVPRQWSIEAKKAIVAEAKESGATISSVARRHDLDRSQLRAWIRKAANTNVESTSDTKKACADTTPGTACAVVELPGGIRITVGNDYDVVAVRRLVETLRGL
jgi:transposase